MADELALGACSSAYIGMDARHDSEGPESRNRKDGCMRSFIFVVALLIPTAGLAQEQAELPEYTAEQRWERTSQLFMVAVVAAIRHAKDSGQSVEEFGRWWTDLFDDSWGQPESAGPGQVLLGMRRNWLSFHGGEVEVLELGDGVASARFNREPYLDVFGDDGVLYGVTVEEFELVNSLFGRGIGDYHALVYEDSISDDGWVMTFRRE